MVYVQNFDEFYARAEEMFRADPMGTRYVTKYRHCDGKLVLKVTDDKVCLKFKTDQLVDLKKMDKLNNLFFTVMVKGPAATVDVEMAAAAEQAPAPVTRKGKARRG
mmetsp:Transcript_9825/g.31909  ORF Transcript_9825/g.31909 Transcript_9825/m.31909 type:complete len:106 (-) Transcript_9825:69-386(-)